MSSVFIVPKEGKSFADHPEYKSKVQEIFKTYGDVLVSWPCKDPAVRGAFGDALIPRKQVYRLRCHPNFQMKAEREKATVKVLKEFIEGGRI